MASLVSMFVRMGYTIGVPDPVSVHVDCEGTATVDEGVLAEVIQGVFPLRPREIISYLKLLRPIYRETAHEGHFGRKGRNFTWERTDKASALRKAVKL